MKSRTLFVALLALSTAACAGEYTAPPVAAAPSDTQAPAAASEAPQESSADASLKDKLTRTVGAAPDALRPSKLPGLMEAQWGSNFAYVTQDGSFAIFGDAVNLDTQEQITEGVRRADRLSLLSGLGDDKVVTFSPAKPQYTVTVFTDVDCGYCRMLHRQMAEYNTKGIAVRYLFYPRSGPGTDSYRKAEAVMCAKDLKAAMDEAKNTGDYKGPSNCGNKLVDAQYEIGTQFGLRGTPMIVLPDGETIPGYVPPDQLAARLVAIDLQKSAATKVN